MRNSNFLHMIVATKYSLAGLKRAWKGEQAFRQEVFGVMCVVMLLLFIQPGVYWSCLLIGAWVFLMVVELLNSAIEEAFDRFGTEYNEHTKDGKDMASSAVFLALCVNLGLWIAMLYYTFC